MIKIVVIMLLLIPSIAFGIDKADEVLVIKSKSKLYLKREGRVLREYKVSFGANPEGHKLEQGDKRTPEGKYILDRKNDYSCFYKAIRISYPNEADKGRAKELGVDPGGLIMIHGQKNGFGCFSSVTERYNWTDGCIAASDSAMDEIWQAVDVGTPIEIKP